MRSRVGLSLLLAAALMVPAGAAANAGTGRVRGPAGDAAERLRASAARSAPSAREAGARVVVSGLNNPRQVSFGPDLHSIVVAEAGRGGRKCGEFGCWGRTGSITLVRRPGETVGAAPNRVVRGLVSAAGPQGEFAVGSDGACARRLNRIHIAMAFAPRRFVPDGVPAWQLGKLLRGDLSGDVSVAANVTAVERSDPDGQGFDSNPYGVLCLRNRQIVADAGGNTLVDVRDGRARLLTVFPDHDGGDAVPTSLTAGPDGNIYVGDLGHLRPGAARVWKVSRSGEILGYRGGFTSVVGVDVTQDGTLYVSELFGGREGFGRITKVAPDGTRSRIDVPLPGGLVVHAGKVYVAVWSISDADGADLGGFTLEPGALWRLRF